MSVRPASAPACPPSSRFPSRVRPWEREVDGSKILTRHARPRPPASTGCRAAIIPLVPVSRAQAMGPTWFDAGSTLAFVAGVTTRIRLLPHVLVLPYRHPLSSRSSTARSIISRAAGVILGVGSGHLKPEFKTLGADFERAARVTDEYLRAHRGRMGGGGRTFDGETISFRDVMVSPRVGAAAAPAVLGRRQLERGGPPRGARCGDGWIPWQLGARGVRAKTRDTRAAPA